MNGIAKYCSATPVQLACGTRPGIEPAPVSIVKLAMDAATLQQLGRYDAQWIEAVDAMFAITGSSGASHNCHTACPEGPNESPLRFHSPALQVVSPYISILYLTWEGTW